eukprot:6374268-Prymnesium_polylepis.2
MCIRDSRDALARQHAPAPPPPRACAAPTLTLAGGLHAGSRRGAGHAVGAARAGLLGAGAEGGGAGRARQDDVVPRRRARAARRADDAPRRRRPALSGRHVFSAPLRGHVSVGVARRGARGRRCSARAPGGISVPAARLSGC